MSVFSEVVMKTLFVEDEVFKAQMLAPYILKILTCHLHSKFEFEKLLMCYYCFEVGGIKMYVLHNAHL